MTASKRIWLVAHKGAFEVGADINANYGSVELVVGRLNKLAGVVNVRKLQTDLPSWRIAVSPAHYDDESRLEALRLAVLKEFSGYEPGYYINDGTIRTVSPAAWKERIAEPF